MQNKANSKTEDSLSGVAIAKTERQNTEDSKIMAKDKPNMFYNCRESSTNQAYFLQNKPNSLKAQINANSLVIKDYENKPRLRAPEKQTQSNPIFKSEDRRQKAEGRRQKAEYRPLAAFFRRWKATCTEINFSLWPDKKSGWLKKCRVAKIMETKRTISPDVA